MNNYMQQIAEMLGVELGEVFYVCTSEHTKEKYMIEDSGLYQCVCVEGVEKAAQKSNKILAKIITGELEIEKRPWKPDVNGDYYKVYKLNDKEIACVVKAHWYGTGDSENLADWKVGNCFRTQEEAEEKGLCIISQLESEFRKA